MKSIRLLQIIPFLFCSIFCFSQATKILLDRQVVSPDVDIVSIPVKVVDFNAVNEMDLVIEWGNQFDNPIQIQDIDFNFTKDFVAVVNIVENTANILLKAVDNNNINLPDSTILLSLNFSLLTQDNELAILRIKENSQVSTIKNNQVTKLDYYPQDGYILILPEGFIFYDDLHTVKICEGDNFSGRYISGDYITLFLVKVNNIVSKAIGKFKVEVLDFSNLDCIKEQKIKIPEEYDYVNIPIMEGYSISANECSNLMKTEIISTSSEAFSEFNPTRFYTHNLLGPGINQYKYTFDNGNKMATCNATFEIEKSNVESDIKGFKISDNNVRVDDHFIVDISAENIKDVIYFSMDLDWDSDKVNFASILPAPELEGYNYTFDTELINEGKLSLRLRRLVTGTTINLSDEAILFSLILQAKKQGDFHLKFENGISGSSTNDKDFNEDFITYKTGKVEIEPRGTCSNATSNKTVQICQNETYEFRNKFYKESGIYRDTLVRENGCDSIFQLTLIVANQATFGKATVREDYTTCNPTAFHNLSITSQFLQVEWTTKNNDIIIESPDNDILRANNLPIGDSKFYLRYSTNTCPVFSIDSFTVNYMPLVTEINAQICEGETYTFNNQTYTNSGNYQATLPSILGCDTIVNLQLEVLPRKVTEINVQICQGENYILNNQAYNQSGNYQANFTAKNGCDSTVNLQLVVLSDIENNISAQICQGENYILNNQAYNQSGNYQTTFTTTNGCDSIINLQLDVLPNIENNINAQICERENYILNNQAYNQSGNYQATFTAKNGCDSTVNLQLEVLPNKTTEITTQIREGENYILNNQAYNQNGTYQATFIGENGCDSIVIVQLEVLPPLDLTCISNDTLFIPTGFSNILTGINPFQTIKDNFPNVDIRRTDNTFFEENWFKLGVNGYVYSFDNGGIKDSCSFIVEVIEENIETAKPIFEIVDKEVLEDDVFEVDIRVRNVKDAKKINLQFAWDYPTLEFQFISNSFPDPLLNFNLGHSDIWAALYITAKDTSTFFSIPDNSIIFSMQFRAMQKGKSEISFFGKNRYTSSSRKNTEIQVKNGTTFKNTDAIFKNGIINVLDKCSENTSNIITQICNGENYSFNNQVYNQSGNYQAIFTANNGCDSIINLQLDVLPNIENNITAQICEGENYIFNNQAYNQSGNYQATFIAKNGCDSTVNLQLTIVENITIENTATICEGESYNFDNQILTQAGTYQKTVVGNNGCDSTINLQLTVLPNYESNLSENICQGENYILNNQAYNQSGNYQSTFTASNGCDSIVNLNLSVLAVPAAFPDTVVTNENVFFNFSVLDNDLLNGVNYELQLISPPHVGKLALLADNTFSYKPRLDYSGSTTFTYQLCNEVCLPDGCTTASVTIQIEGEASTIESAPLPVPIPPINYETSKIQTLAEGELYIYNIWGQLVEQRHFRQDSQQQLWNLQQSELPAGIYFYVKKAVGQREILESGKIVAIGR